MRNQRIFTATALLAALATTVTGCRDTQAGSVAADGTAAAPARSASPATAAGAAGATGGGAAAAGRSGLDDVRTLEDAQRYVRQWRAQCEDLSNAPTDSRLPLTDLTNVGRWGVTERGVCSDRVEDGELIFYMTSDMKAFQAGYKKRVRERIDAGDTDYGMMSRVFVGKHFAVTPTSTRTALELAKSDLRVLTCNPFFGVPRKYKKEKALVEHCVLSDWVGAENDEGSPNFDRPQQGPSGELGQPKQGTGGLAQAGSLAELKKLVHPNLVDCTNMYTDAESIGVRSIDYNPAVTDDDWRSWGIKDRAICGQLGGARRAHNLNWLSTVRDMKVLQTKARDAQQEDLKDGRLEATTAKLMLGGNVAVEATDPSVRFGLYQAQFLYLNCEPGFGAPSGYRVEKSLVDGCVLTNYEKDHPAAG
ncbi:hypothetical protein LG634_04405 [Streptomyces bambusae]|uniref:hypothetical protein n=1 Tax=Streptomyces bambusae TaxID=1550616 RepID=UPI001CFF4AFB|nr:hypothetical protein [Streptomyces bambusae]MCB5164078.1 hypothetical protein [Streptomyces bambusae]